MQRLAGRAVFTVGGREYGWEDVALAAHLWGEAASLKRRTREGIACVRHLERLGDKHPETEVEEAADAWRYARDLLSGDDMHAWLEERMLTMDDWLAYVLHTVLRTRWSAELGRITKEQKVSSRQIESALYGEAVCSGRLAELADRLAGQAAIYEREVGESKTRRPKGCSKAELRAVLKGLPRGEGFLGARPVPTERAEFVACVTLSFDGFVERLTSPAAVEREIEARTLDWTRIDCETVRFSGEDPAREATLLVREDGLSLAEAAATARAPLEEHRYLLEDVAPPLRDRLVGARPGELIGSPSGDGGFVLISVLDRVEPSSKDRAIRKRAAEALVRRTVQREVGKRVRWHERF